MNKDTFWNVTIGVLSAILIGGGAYMMATGSSSGKVANQEALTVETTTTESATSNNETASSEVKTEVKKDESKDDSIKKSNKTKVMNIEGMTVEVKKEGEGEVIKSGQTAVVHYTGKFPDGKVFDSSVSRGQPFAFQLGSNMVIQGWEKGVLGMKKGEERTLTIPPELAYGANGAGGVIPPNATLIFEVALVDIK